MRSAPSASGDVACVEGYGMVFASVQLCGDVVGESRQERTDAAEVV